MRVRRSVDRRASSVTASPIWPSTWALESAEVATPVMFAAISPDPAAASATPLLISFVVAVCSSTADAIVSWKSLIDAMIAEISPIAATAPVVSVWIAATRRAISPVARAVSCASSLTSPATTANPLPASPARAASIVAFSANKFVCSAMLVITLTTSPISCELTPNFETVSFVAAATPVARFATFAASFAFWAISRIDAPICSAPAATACTLRLTCSAAAATTPACTLVSCDPAATCDVDADSSSADDATNPADQIDRLDKALTAAGVRHRGEVYAGAHHGFTQADTAMHSPEATERHWTALLNLLARTL